MIPFLTRLKSEFIPTNILDIGAEKGTWTLDALKIFGHNNYTLIEPIEYTELNKFKKHGNPFKVIHTILNDYDGEVDWYEMKNTGDSIKKNVHIILVSAYHLKKNVPNWIHYFKMKNSI